ncbi:hypothetical protein HMPREF9465_00972 [Sutterella wadsworthensis 2_1_59BFAA]|uniref:Transposase IS4-like domain-containing protein n=1 Tax=Sutterella wadsworthensis 2_1_59BFAA TaxID=742823 RepID=K1JIC9_9BURK|nr:hypothetical protein [Sutterella wadsworthensis]EKB31420.1 hypothetical protein HMPREF9465_00972 [Sutterella wadsworthensis 2_1_59BFAA]
MLDLQPGNIPDVASAINAIKRVKTYGLKKPELVLDNGFFSKDNVRAFVTAHVGFTMRATLNDRWIYRLIDEETASGRLARGVSGFLCLGRLFQGQPNEAALCFL